MRDADGSRLDARVVVYREGRTGRYTPFREVETSGWYDPAGVGGFRVAQLPPGRYRLEFGAVDPAYAGEFWDDAGVLANASTVELAAGQTAAHLDPVLTAAGP